jgi:glycerol kinase
VVNTKPGHSVRSAAQAAAAGKTKGLQQQQPEDTSQQQQQQQQQQGGVSQQLQHGSVVSWLLAEEPEVGSAQALQHTQVRAVDAALLDMMADATATTLAACGFRIRMQYMRYTLVVIGVRQP